MSLSRFLQVSALSKQQRMRSCKPSELRNIRWLLIIRERAKTHIGPLDDVFWACLRYTRKRGKELVVSPRLSGFFPRLFLGGSSASTYPDFCSLSTTLRPSQLAKRSGMPNNLN